MVPLRDEERSDEMTGGPGDRTRGCSVVFAAGLEEAWMELGQGSEALELDGMAVGGDPWGCH